jgi:two-component system chemotaxis response regulator CheY
MKILLIEDIADLREILREQLECEGFIILEAGNGKEGLDVLEKSDIDLVISDIDMPVMTGLDFLRWAKTLEKKAPPIYIMTGAGRVTKEQCLEEGACAYFEKGSNIIESMIGTIKSQFSELVVN